MVIDTLKQQYKGKKVLIVGLGLLGGGVGLVRFFCELGAQVRVSDLKNERELQSSLDALSDCSFELISGEHRIEDTVWAEVIFKGPSVPWSIPIFQEAITRGISIEMEASFFASLCPCPIIGVTGTRGKSTTTMMIAEVLKAAGFSVEVGGNIAGVSTISFLKFLTSAHVVILELSSWQLSGFHRKHISPHIAVFTNIYPDHLNYYSSMDEYLYDKKAIYLYQKAKDVLVAHESLKSHIQDSPSQQVFFTADDFPHKLRYLKGVHNQENAAAAFCACLYMGVSKSSIVSTLKKITPLPFRCEPIAKIQGVTVYNDATSTTPIACEKAIETFSREQIVLILGGNSKKLPIKELVRKINLSVAKVVLLQGSFTDEIAPLIKKTKFVHANSFSSLNEAFEKALQEAILIKGIVIFSPAATSFSLFKNEFHRGEKFTRIVKEYEKKLTDTISSL